MAATPGRRQRRLLLGRERYHLPAEQARCGPLAEEPRYRAADGVGTTAWMAARHPGGDGLQACPDGGDIVRAPLATAFFVGAAMHEDDSARQGLLGARVGEGVLEHGKAVLFVGQGGVAVAAALLFARQEA